MSGDLCLTNAVLAAGVLFDLLSFPAAAAAGAVQEIQLSQTLLDQVSQVQMLNSSQPIAWP